MFYTSFIDSVFNDVIDTLKKSDYSYVVSSNVKGLEDINSLSQSDVPYNQYVDEEKNLYFEFALAGVSKDSIEITKTNHEISITVKATEEMEKKFAYTYKGIKFPKNKDILVATIDVTDMYEDEPSISFENGLLNLKFTIKPEEKPRKLSIK